jgi:hypothetical protein
VFRRGLPVASSPKEDAATMTATAAVRFTVAGHAPGLAPGGPPERPPAHFTTVATAAIRGRALGLSPWAKLLYVVLRSYAGPDGTCYPGYATLRADVGCGVAQLTRAVRELEAAGLVARRRRGQGRTTLYTVRVPGTVPPEPPRAPLQTRPRGGSRVAPAASLDSPQRRAEQDSGDLDPAEHHHGAPTAADGERNTGAGDDALLAALEEHGVTRRIARRLVATHGARAVRAQLDWHPHRPAATNPAGALVRAIRDTWPAPSAWAEAQARTAAAARQVEAERERRAEEDARRREQEAKPPEERIAGRLTFWLAGQRRKRREPAPAEVEAKRSEFLADLIGGGVDTAAVPRPSWSTATGLG